MSLAIGEQRQYDGIYVVNWEVARFEVVTGKRFFGLFENVERCHLVTADGVESIIDKLFGGELPDDWRHHGAVSFALSFDGCAIENGRFGHMGWCRWRVRLDKWLSVKNLDSWGATKCV
jgi:hypothetical protein